MAPARFVGKACTQHYTTPPTALFTVCYTLQTSAVPGVEKIKMGADVEAGDHKHACLAGTGAASLVHGTVAPTVRDRVRPQGGGRE